MAQGFAVEALALLTSTAAFVLWLIDQSRPAKTRRADQSAVNQSTPGQSTEETNL